MIYSYYSIPKFERSSSLDREIYRSTRNRPSSGHSFVRSFNRASSLSPINCSERDYVPQTPTYSYRRRQRSVSFDDDILPTSNLKAHTAPKYSYVFAPQENYIQRRPIYLDDDIYPISQRYRTHYSYNYPSTLNNRYYSSNHNFYYPTSKSSYGLSRVPENPYYYRYNVLPYYGFDANDMIRQRRRRIDSHIGFSSDFHDPPLNFYSGIKKNLNDIYGKMESHRLLLDRYTGIDMNPNSSNVGDNILEKSLQMSYRRRY